MGHLAQAQKDIMTVVAQIVADFTDYPLVVQAPNRVEVDQALQENPYLVIEIDELGADQADMADRPRVKQLGQIVLYAVCKIGSGSLKSQDLRDFVTPYFDMKDIGIVRTHAVEAYKAKEEKGWRYSPLLVNYWYHRTS